MEAVRGLQGNWHFTEGLWANSGGLKTLCGRGISPNYRRMNVKSLPLPACAKCKIKK